MKAYSKAILWLSLTLIVGVALGSVTTVLILKKKPEWGENTPPSSRSQGPSRREDAFLKEMVDKLHLDREQEARVRKILDENQKQLKELERRRYREIHQFRKETHSQIREVLKPEQQAMFDEFLEQLGERWRQRRKKPRENDQPAPGQ